MAKRKIALVLSGGGAKGAFQYGAEKYAREVKGYHWDIIAGVSVGALNATMLAMEKYEALERIWSTISDDKVYSGRINFWSVLKLFFGSTSLYTNKPLRALIKKEVDPANIKKDLRIGVVSLETGAFISFRTKDQQFEKNFFQKILLASTAVPIIWPPVDASWNYRNLVDGGLRNINPLGDVLDEDPDEIVIINCNPRKTKVQKKIRTISDITKYSLNILLNEIFVSDMEEFLRINKIVKDARKRKVTLYKENGKPYKYYKCKIIEPLEDLGDMMDFSQYAVQKSISKGQDRAKQALN
jgi:NTE family protein